MDVLINSEIDFLYIVTGNLWFRLVDMALCHPEMVRLTFG